MCVILIDKKNKVISDDVILAAYAANNDGFGGMFAANGKIHSYKCFNANSALNWYKENKSEHPNSIFVLHFRISTGGTGIGNSHPFKVSNSLFFVHNGHIHGFGDKSKNKSDTNEFRNFLQLLPENFLNINICKKAINTMIGQNNKLVFLDSFGNVTCFNEHLFSDFKDFRASNKSFEYFLFKNDQQDDYLTDSTIDDFIESACYHCSSLNCDNCTKYKDFISGRQEMF